MSVRKNRAALLKEKHGNLVVDDTTFWEVKPHEVLVRNISVAINPVDWKIQKYGIIIDTFPAILGCDSAGIVDAVGEGVTGIAKGDRVLAHTTFLGAWNPAFGGFQNYSLVFDNQLTPIPLHLSFDEACVLPLSLATATHGLFGSSTLHLERPSSTPNPSLANKSVLVWGAASSVGASAVQLAARSGYTVIATASPANHSWVTALGAARVFDYNDPDVISKLKGAVQGEWVGAYDSISEGGTVEACAQVIEKGSIAITPPPPQLLPAGVTTVNMMAGSLARGDPELGRWLFREYLPSALVNGEIKPAPAPELVGHGLDKIQAGLEAQQRARGKKIVVRIGEP